MIKIRHPKSSGYFISYKTCNKRRQKYFIQNRADKKHLDAEYRPADGSAEYGGKSGADAANHQFFSVFITKPEEVSKLGSQGCANLGTRAFFADRTAGRQRNDRRRQFDRHNGCFNFAGAFMYGLNNFFSPMARGIRFKKTN